MYNDPSTSRKRLQVIAAIILTVIVLPILFVSWNSYKQHRYYTNLAKQLSAEESGDEQFASTPPSKADTYVGDFKYVSAVTVSAKGFSPSNIVVKPETKVIFTGADNAPHFLMLAPGSKSPKYFDPQVNITRDTVFQTKLETPGTYSFYDRNNPMTPLVITVSKS